MITLLRTRPRALRAAPLVAGALAGTTALTAAGAQVGATTVAPPSTVPLSPGIAAPATGSAIVRSVRTASAADRRRPTRTTAHAGSSWADRIVLAGEYAHLGAGSLDRNAGPSMDASAGYDLRASGLRDGSGPRLELGWLRAARPPATAQGATAGVSYGVRVPLTGGRLTLRPGLAVLAGWSESQGGDWYYDWRGLPGTTNAGATGTVDRPRPVRSSALGVGAALGASFRLGAGAALTGAVRPWKFSGTAAAPLGGVTTLAGVGVSLRPGAWRHHSSADAGAETTGVRP